MGWWWLSWVVLAVAIIRDSGVRGGEVTYDGRSLIVDGQRKILFSGSIHYPRSTPEMWPSLIAKAKEGGVDVIQTYVFWNLHEPKPGEYDFSGRNDVVGFVKEIQAQGLYVCLRIGPFIESEWTYGGFPFWLHDVPDIVYRSDNEPFKFYMQNFTTKIVSMMKSEGLYASQGGPIILSQIENEYQNVEAAFGDKGPPYVLWAAKMAVDLQTGVPWAMCKQADAPDPVINTCNGMRCGETFGGPNSPTKPSLWTENWTSFYQVYGGEPYIRSAEDIAFHVTLFIAKKGSYINYYMFHGGTNFGRTASAYVITGYYDQAPLDEYGLIRQPKWGHLKDLHAAIKSCSTTILEGVQSNFSLGQLQQAYIFEEKGAGCAAFLVNNDQKNNATVEFRNITFELLPKSISILPDCENIIFNTAKVNLEGNEITRTSSQLFDDSDRWEAYTDVIPNFADTNLKSDTLLEHMNTTKDKSDYLWYTFSFQPNSSCTEPVLHVESLAHVASAFVNNKYAGSAHGSKDAKGPFTMEAPIVLNDEMNNISILSTMVGLPDSGAFLERRYAGLTRVEIRCAQQEVYNFTNNYEWGYQVGLRGENLNIYMREHLGNIEWNEVASATDQPLTWFKIEFDAPKGDDPVVLNLSTMGKGEAWVNGQSIGRYWLSFLTSRGQPSQTLYHIPRAFLNTSGNLLVLLEESGGDPLHISVDTVSRTGLQEHASREAFAFRSGPVPPFLTYFRFDGNGNKQPDVPIFSMTRPSFLHDFGISSKYAIFADIQIGMNPMQMIFGGGSPVGSDPAKVPRLGIIPRYAKDESEMKWFDVPGFNLIHAINAWDEEDAIVMLAPNILSVEHTLERMDLIHALVEKVRIDLRTGIVTRNPVSARNLDFGVINPAYLGKKNRYVYAAIGDPMPKISGVVKLDVSRGERRECTVATRIYGPRCFGGEPFFVARVPENPEAEEDDGYVVSYVHDEIAGESKFLVMDAESPVLDIVAAVKLPRRVPYGFHGLFVKESDLKKL